jgi:parallel beta-helix repeat protein
MLTRLLTPLLLGLSMPWAASYHIAANGDDSRSAAQAGNPTTPWKTLAQLATVRVNPGDSILLRRGDVWYETLVIRRSGTAASPVIVAPYGSGSAMPELHGTIPLTGTLAGGQYSAKLAAGQNVKAVFSNKEPLQCARYPETGWITASSVEGHTAVTAPAAAGQNWVGASIHLRTTMWTLETHRVVSQEGGRLVLSAKSVNALPDSVQFFFTNHTNALSASSRPGWAYSTADSTLRWKGIATPIEAAVLPMVVDISGFDHVRISGLRLFGSTVQAVKLVGSNLHVENCQIDYPGLMGVMMKQRQNRFAGNRITGAVNNAVSGIGAAHTIEGNTIRRTALLANFGPDGMGEGCCGGRGIDFAADSSILARNIIDSTGYIGLGFKGLNSLVEENVISNSCMTTDDCSGLYSYTGKYANAGSKGSIVRRNFVSNAVGAPSGWKSHWAASNGIYLDDGSQDITADSNVVWGNAKGFYLHNTQRIKMRGNTVFNNTTAQLVMTHDGTAGVGDMTDNVVSGNLFVALPGQGADPQTNIQQIQSQPLGTMTNNTICSYQIVSTTCWNEAGPLWKRSTLEPNDSRLGAETQTFGTFDNAAQGWTSWPAQTKITAETGSACGTGGCMKVVYSGGSQTLNPLFYAKQNIGVTKGQAWQLTFRARSLRSGQNLAATLRRTYGDYAILGFLASVRLDTNWTNHSFLFRSSETEANARIDFRSSFTDSVYWIDDISMRSVPDSLLKSPAPPVLLTNPTPSIVGLPVVGAPWMDAWGARQSTDLILPAWQAKVVFPYQGWATSIHGKTTAMPLRILRTGSTWEFRGLTGPSTVIDVRGRTLAQLQPDASGNARWQATGATGMAWLRTGNQTRTLISP